MWLHHTRNFMRRTSTLLGPACPHCLNDQAWVDSGGVSVVHGMHSIMLSARLAQVYVGGGTDTLGPAGHRTAKSSLVRLICCAHHLQGPTRHAALRLDEAVMAKRVQWLKAIREWQDEFLDHVSAAEFVDCILGDLMGKSVFVFTPLGDLLRLPKVCPWRSRCLS